MKKDIFKLALPLILKNEGGYVYHPLDKGGPTNKGITQGVYDAYIKNGKNKSVRYITDEEVEDIYYRKYWVRCKADKLPIRTAIVHFDTSINWGVHGAAKILQAILRVKTDGIIGKKTLGAIKEMDDLTLALKYCDFRIERRYKIVDKNSKLKVFLNGWINRDKRVKRFIKKIKNKK